MARSRALFDLRPFHGSRPLWGRVRGQTTQAVDRDIVQVLAHDCLASLPPMTFYQDAVIEQSGEQTTVFRLEHSALRPLVDLGRVFSMAGRDVLGIDALDRLVSPSAAGARGDLPGRGETLRIVLWQQGRVGIA